MCKETVHVHYTFSIHPVHVLCTGSRRASTRGQSWCVRKPYTFITRSVYIQYTSCVRAVDGPVHAVNPGMLGTRTRSVHFSTHPYTSCVQAVDGLVHAVNPGMLGTRTRSVHFSTHPYTSCVQAVDGQCKGQYTRLFVPCAIAMACMQVVKYAMSSTLTLFRYTPVLERNFCVLLIQIWVHY